MPIPRAINRHCWRCSGVASRRRGNHSRGTDTSLPSDKRTVKASSENRTSTAKTLVGLMGAEVFIPFLQEECGILFDQLPELAKFTSIIANSPIEQYRRQPELGSVFC